MIWLARWSDPFVAPPGNRAVNRSEPSVTLLPFQGARDADRVPPACSRPRTVGGTGAGRDRAPRHPGGRPPLSMTVGQVRRAVSRLVEAGLVGRKPQPRSFCPSQHRRVLTPGGTGIGRGPGRAVDSKREADSLADISWEPG